MNPNTKIYEIKRDKTLCTTVNRPLNIRVNSLSKFRISGFKIYAIKNAMKNGDNMLSTSLTRAFVASQLLVTLNISKQMQNATMA